MPVVEEIMFMGNKVTREEMLPFIFDPTVRPNMTAC